MVHCMVLLLKNILNTYYYISLTSTAHLGHNTNLQVTAQLQIHIIVFIQ